MAFETGDKLAEIFVEIKAKQDEFEKQLSTIRKNTDREAQKMGGSFGKMFKKGLAAIGVTAIFAALIAAAKKFAALSIEQAQAQAQVARAVQQTGKAAGFTAKQLEREASALQKITGIGDEITLKNVTNQLLTFKNIAGDVFLRTQRAVQDVNAVINQGSLEGLKSVSIQLGKALNDPITGLTALTRSGITFSEAQKVIIKNLVEQNRLQEAQKIILSEIEAQYGGQAETIADASAGTKQFSESLGDLGERIGARLLPAIERITPVLTRMLDAILPEDIHAGSRALEEQRLTVSALATAASSLAQTDETRLELIRRLQREYPDFLKNLKAEEITNAQLRKRLADVNKELLNRIVIRRAQEREEAAVDKQAEAFRRLVEAQEQAGAAIRKAREELGLETDQSEDLRTQLERLRDVTQDIIKRQREETALVQKGLKERATQFSVAKAVAAALHELREAEEQLSTTEQAAIELAKERARLAAALGISLEETTTSVNKTTSAFKELDRTQVKSKKLSFDDATQGRQFSRDLEDFSEAQQRTFEELSFGAKGYLDARVQFMNLELEHFRSVGVSEENINALKIARLKALENDYTRWLIDQFSDRASHQEQTLFELSEQQKRNFDFVRAGFESIQEGALTAFDEIEVKARSNATALERGFVAMANTFINQVKRMIAQWLAFTAVQSAARLFGLNIPTGAHGGKWRGTKSGVKKAATGTTGAFTVPAGFNRDNFLFGVRSGEEVTVRTPGQVTMTEIGLRTIASKLDALNLNLVTTRQRLQLDAELTSQVEGQDIKLSLDRTNRIRNRLG